MKRIARLMTLLTLAIGLPLAVPEEVRAHCDALDGPVVAAASKALDSRAVARVLIWVPEDRETEVREAFEQTLAVRRLSPRAQALADRYFFETVVRLHRAGEGEPYTGLKPAGGNVGRGVRAADQALEEGSVESLVDLLGAAIEKGIGEHFAQAANARAFNPHDVAAGRRYVTAYVRFIHYVERLVAAAAETPRGHDATSR